MIASPQIAKILSNFDETLNDYGEVRHYIAITRTQHSWKICLKRISKTLSISLKKLKTYFLKTLKYYTQ